MFFSGYTEVKPRQIRRHSVATFYQSRHFLIIFFSPDIVKSSNWCLSLFVITVDNRAQQDFAGRAYRRFFQKLTVLGHLKVSMQFWFNLILLTSAGSGQATEFRVLSFRLIVLRYNLD